MAGPTKEDVLAFVDGAMGAAGHHLSAESDPYGRELLEKVASGEITAEEAIRLKDAEMAARFARGDQR